MAAIWKKISLSKGRTGINITVQEVTGNIDGEDIGPLYSAHAACEEDIRYELKRVIQVEKAERAEEAAIGDALDLASLEA